MTTINMDQLTDVDLEVLRSTCGELKDEHPRFLQALGAAMGHESERRSGWKGDFRGFAVPVMDGLELAEACQRVGTLAAGCKLAGALEAHRFLVAVGVDLVRQATGNDVTAE